MLRKALGLIIALAGSTTSVLAQPYPNRPMTMVVPFAAGGPTDIVARLVGEKMGQLLGQQIIIENIGGAGGMTGSNRVAKAAPDGYQMVMGTVGTHAQNQTLYAKPAYSAADDFAPVALLAEVPLVLISRKDLPPNTLQEFITHTKANQKTMTFASSGAGAAVHLGCLTLNTTIGVDVAHVPYRGSSAFMQDIIGGRVDYVCDVISTVIPQVKGDTVKALALLHMQRSPSLPELKTADEQGLKGFSAYTWNAIFLPKGAPADVVVALNTAATTAMADPTVRKRLEELGYTLATPERMTPAYLGDFVRAEIKKWEGPVKASGVRIE
jgi:tripartite-type tricarboxylate transporter receptor subunit TctC